LPADYYEILGVHPTAEDFIIRAAYRALAHRYHPDKLSPDEAHLADRMAQINEAYDTLSDPGRRKEYDAARQASSAFSESLSSPALDDLFDPPPEGAALGSADWAKACEYYPDLHAIDSRLAEISWKLAWMFRASILESQAFEERKKLSKSLETSFLQLYFGTDNQVYSFGKNLVLGGLREAAEELARAVRVLGSDVPADRIIDRVMRKFKLTGEIEARPNLQRERAIGYCELFRQGSDPEHHALLLIRCLGGVTEATFWKQRPTAVKIWERRFDFAERAEFVEWVETRLVEPLLAGAHLDDLASFE